MKTILVPLEESDVLPSVRIDAIVRRFDSYIEGLYEQPGLTEVVVAGEGLGVTPPDLVETFQQQEKERAVGTSCSNVHERRYAGGGGDPQSTRRRVGLKKISQAVISSEAADVSLISL